MLIPTMILKQLYTVGSLRVDGSDVHFALKNRLSDAVVNDVHAIKINGETIAPERLLLRVNGHERRAVSVTAASPIDFPLRQVIDIVVRDAQLQNGTHQIEIAVDTAPFGAIDFCVDDVIGRVKTAERIPRSDEDDFSPEIIADRLSYLQQRTGVELQHVPHYSFDAHIAAGNCEHFIGVAQIPIGFAGPLKINGEHANGDFLIPLATSEGTLIASYNRGMKVISLSGGVKCTVIGDAMQRAPVFVFDDARGARDFVIWVDKNIDRIREKAEATSRIAKLQYIDHYLANKFAYLRFNFSTGDAAGQNMVGRATSAACTWIIDVYDGGAPIRHFYLESNFATDKKGSMVNVMRTRGKRVVAEATIKREVLIEHLRVTPEQLHYHSQVANVGAFMSGANNNGLHSANGITAIFMATGQDVANVSESSAGIIYVEVTAERDLYLSITIPSLIVATYGGGTGLPTQRECLEILGCYGSGQVRKFAEVVAGLVLAGEVSLAAAISASDWVSSHERYGRNR